MEIYKIEHIWTGYTAYIKKLTRVAESYGWNYQSLCNHKSRNQDGEGNFLFQKHKISKVVIDMD